MKNMILAIGLLFGICANVGATEEVTEKAYQTFLSSGVICSTGSVATNITSRIEVSTRTIIKGYNMAGWRIQNQDSSYSVWIGGDPTVSTTTITTAKKAVLGEKLVGGANGVWPVSNVGYDGSTVIIYCRAEDSAGASGVVLSVAAFGYR
jgi:hypothetical protein